MRNYFKRLLLSIFNLPHGECPCSECVSNKNSLLRISKILQEIDAKLKQK